MLPGKGLDLVDDAHLRPVIKQRLSLNDNTLVGLNPFDYLNLISDADAEGNLPLLHRVVVGHDEYVGCIESAHHGVTLYLDDVPSHGGHEANLDEHTGLDPRISSQELEGDPHGPRGGIHHGAELGHPCGEACLRIGLEKDDRLLPFAHERNEALGHPGANLELRRLGDLDNRH